MMVTDKQAPKIDQAVRTREGTTSKLLVVVTMSMHTRER